MSIYESLGVNSSSSDEEIIRENIALNHPLFEKTSEKIIAFIQTTLQKNHVNDFRTNPITFKIGIGSEKGCFQVIPEGEKLEKFKKLDSTQQQIYLLNYSNELSKSILSQLNANLSLKGVFSSESKLKGPWKKLEENSFSEEINEDNASQRPNEKYIQCFKHLNYKDGISAAFCCCCTIAAVTGSIFLCMASLTGCAVFKASEYCFGKKKKTFNHCQLVITYSQPSEESFLLEY